MRQVKLTTEVFRVLMVCAAFLVCLSHGSNDVGNAISPLIVIFNLSDIKDNYAYLLGSSGIAFGLIIMGKKVMDTVGKDIIMLDFLKGFAS